MSKILHIPNYYYPHIGGIEQTARDIVNSLRDENENLVFCFNSNKETVTEIIDGVRIVRVGTIAKIASQSISLSYSKEIKKVFSEFNPDIVIFHYPNPFVAHFLLKYVKNSKIKLILYWHLDITKQKVLGKFFKKQNENLLKRANKIVATSPNYIEGSPWLIKYKNKCIVIPSCINEQRLKYNNENITLSKSIKKEFSDKCICFAFGRHVEYKGISYLIKASKYLDDKFVILIGGTGPLTKQLMKEARMDGKIKFLGRLTDDELKANLLACDIFCFPSITKNEAFGLGLAEAMYYGKPAVTFNIPGSGVNYVSLNGVTGIEVENKNSLEYAKALTGLVNDKERYELFSKNSKIRVEENFTYLKFNNKITSLIDTLVKD